MVASALRKTAAPGPALIFGTSDHVDVLNAALINGTASHALDFDDCSNTLGGHPSAPILPALWAIAPGSSGKAFIAAYAAGFECETRLARAVNFHHYEKGWHPTATLGTFGSAAACAHLLALNVEQTATALALAASMASGIKANFGTMTKPFHVGHTTRNGLLAALLAKEGMTANIGALEHTQGFFAVYNGAGNFKPERFWKIGASRSTWSIPASRSSAIPAAAARIPPSMPCFICVRRIACRRSESPRSNPGHIRAGSRTPTGPIRKAASTASSRSNTCSPAR